MIDTTKLKQVSDGLQVIYSSLNHSLLTDYMPIAVESFDIHIFDEETYSFLRTCLLDLIKEHNHVLNIFNQYNLNPFSDIQVNPVSYDDKGSNLNKSISAYTQTLDLLIRNNESIKTIMQLNGLLTEDK